LYVRAFNSLNDMHTFEYSLGTIGKETNQTDPPADVSILPLFSPPGPLETAVVGEKGDVEKHLEHLGGTAKTTPPTITMPRYKYISAKDQDEPNLTIDSLIPGIKGPPS